MSPVLRISSIQRKRLLLPALLTLASLIGAWWALDLSATKADQLLKYALVLDFAILLALGILVKRTFERRVD
ncbi:MAG: hypothetical protein IPG74_08145 [Flavobacteriales bacterium]|nr:hypothetical protein [Flavobacteriales bacterium]MBK9195650.1 hypothetical protein [Flavobacteriales bacterium]MBP6573950.1 hypothetical protein [Flavobacteriales bacterium]